MLLATAFIFAAPLAAPSPNWTLVESCPGGWWYSAPLPRNGSSVIFFSDRDSPHRHETDVHALAALTGARLTIDRIPRRRTGSAVPARGGAGLRSAGRQPLHSSRGRRARAGSAVRLRPARRRPHGHRRRGCDPGGGQRPRRETRRIPGQRADDVFRASRGARPRVRSGNTMAGSPLLAASGGRQCDSAAPRHRRRGERCATSGSCTCGRRSRGRTLVEGVGAVMITLNQALFAHLHRRDDPKQGLLDAVQAAVQLERATLPPYLYALYSLDQEKNGVIAELIRSVFMEEMLHVALAANLLNALGGEPRIASFDTVPRYPGPLPGGVEHGVIVHLAPFSDSQLDTFLQIEAPENVLAFRVSGVRGRRRATAPDDRAVLPRHSRPHRRARRRRRQPLHWRSSQATRHGARGHRQGQRRGLRACGDRYHRGAGRRHRAIAVGSGCRDAAGPLLSIRGNQEGQGADPQSGCASDGPA